MKMFLFGFLVCYIISCGVVFACDPMAEGVAKIWMAPFLVAALIVLYPFYFIYHVFLRHVIFKREKVNIERAAKVAKDYSIRRVIGKIYFYHDRDATKFINRFFFVRSTEPLILCNHQVVC